MSPCGPIDPGGPVVHAGAQQQHMLVRKVLSDSRMNY